MLNSIGTFFYNKVYLPTKYLFFNFLEAFSKEITPERLFLRFLHSLPPELLKEAKAEAIRLALPDSNTPLKMRGEIFLSWMEQRLRPELKGGIAKVYDELTEHGKKSFRNMIIDILIQKGILNSQLEFGLSQTRYTQLVSQNALSTPEKRLLNTVMY